MRDYIRILSRLKSELWMATPETMRAIYSTLIAAQNGAAVPSQAAVHTRGGTRLELDEEGAGFDSNTGLYMAAPGIAVITVSGVIGKRLHWIESLCGGYDLDMLTHEIDRVLANDKIHSVIIDFDTPGGSVTGLYEAALKIRELDQAKNCVAYTETLRASAGEYLASQCSRVVATKSSTCGSIGTVLSWIDETAAMEKAGLKLVVFQGGKFKTAGYDGKPLTDEEKALFQGKVDKCYAEFKAMVRHHRPDIAEDVCQGQTFDGDEAVQAGICDEVVLDIHEVIDSLREEETPTPVGFLG
jgi:signal peptide peptidase SppA